MNMTNEILTEENKYKLEFFIDIMIRTLILGKILVTKNTRLNITTVDLIV